MHYTVMVIGGDVEGQLAPYDENYECGCQLYENEGTEDETYVDHDNSCDYNGKWDWYQIGGRWSGYLRLKPEHTTGAIVERSWVWDRTPEDELPSVERLMADQAIMRDIDWDYMRLDAQIRGMAGWETLHEIIATHGNPSPMPPYGGDNVAWQEWRSSPVVQAIQQALGWNIDWHDMLGKTQEQYGAQCALAAGICSSTLYEGTWIEGDGGILSPVSSTYCQEIKEILDGLDGDTLITVVDCHT